MTIREQGVLADEPVGSLEPVAYFHGAMPTGVSVSYTGRIFVNFPKWGDDVQFTVAELRDGAPVAYPEPVQRTWRIHDVFGWTACRCGGTATHDWGAYRQPGPTTMG